MRSIIMSSINARLLIVAAAAAVVFFGIYNLQEAPKGVFPEFSPVYVEVQTEALGLSADEIEQLITVSLEQDLLNGIAFLDEIWSESMPGLSRVVCVFEPGTDPMVARQVVAERMTQAHALPNVSKPPIMLQPYSSTSRVMKVGLTPSSNELSLIDLSVLTRWNIQPYLMGVEGVANVSIWGQRKRQLQVQVDPKTLADKGVTLHEVIKTTGEALWVSPLSYLNSSTPGTGGFFDTPNQRIGIRHLLPISTPNDLAQLPLYGHDMLLGDVSTVVENHQPLIGDAIINGNPGLMLVIEKFPWASTTEVTDNVEEALEALSPGLSGVTFDTEIYQPASFIETSFENLSTGLVIAIGIVVLFLFLFFYEWKGVFISLVSISLSLLAAASVLYLQGTIFDMMVIAGLVVALGVIIDDAITTVEHVRSQLDQAPDEEGKNNIDTVLKAVYKVRSPILFATSILLLAVTPLFFIEGVFGAFLKPFAFSYVLALLASTLTAMVVTPALSVMLFPKSGTLSRNTPLLNNVQRIFESGVEQITRKPAIAYLTLGIFALIGLISVPMINMTPSIPIPQERDLIIKWESPHGTSHPEMARLTNDAISKLKTISGVRNVAAHIGRAVMSDKVVNVHAGEIWVNLDDEADYDKSIGFIQQVIDKYPNISAEVMTYQEQSLNKSMTGSEHLYAVRVYGENQEMITKKAEEVQKALSGITRIEKSKVEYPPTEPTLEIVVDLEKAKGYNIKPGDVRRAAATLLAGIGVGSLFEGQKVFEVVVWGIPDVRNSIQSVKDLLVDIPEGGYVRLGDVATVREKQNPAIVKREKVSRYMDVSFSLIGGNTNSLATEINKSLETIDFPLEYHAELVGEFRKIQATKSQMASIVFACLIGIFLLLQAAFWSWRLALVVFPSLLIALSGGFLAILINGGDLSLGSLAGLLGVLGVASYNAILLIKHFKFLEVFQGETLNADLIQKGAKNRIKPILMTTILTILVFLPIVFLGNVPGFEMIYPMSLVMIGGLISSLMVNLFALPALYLLLGKTPDAIIKEEKTMMELENIPIVPSI